MDRNTRKILDYISEQEKKAKQKNTELERV